MLNHMASVSSSDFIMPKISYTWRDNFGRGRVAHAYIRKNRQSMVAIMACRMSGAKVASSWLYGYTLKFGASQKKLFPRKPIWESVCKTSAISSRPHRSWIIRCVINIRKDTPWCLTGEACAHCYELGLQINLITKSGLCAVSKPFRIIKA